MKALATMMVMGMIGGFATSAKAIDLRNESDLAYQVKVTSSAMSRDITINSLTLSFIVCVGECSFEVDGLGVVRASKDDVVTFADGKLVVTPGVSRTAQR